jgi:hypothetical protein
MPGNTWMKEKLIFATERYRLKCLQWCTAELQPGSIRSAFTNCWMIQPIIVNYCMWNTVYNLTGCRAELALVRLQGTGHDATCDTDNNSFTYFIVNKHLLNVDISFVPVLLWVILLFWWACKRQACRAESTHRYSTVSTKNMYDVENFNYQWITSRGSEPWTSRGRHEDEAS